MKKTIKKPGCSLSIDGKAIVTKNPFRKEHSINDIRDIKFDIEYNGFCCLSILFKSGRFAFPTKLDDSIYKDYCEVYEYLVNTIYSSKLIDTYSVDYDGGLPLYVYDDSVVVDVFENMIRLSAAKSDFTKTATIDFKNISNIKYNEKEIVKRKRTETKKFLTFDYTNENNLTSSVAFSGWWCDELHSALFKAYSEYLSKNPTVQKDSSSNNSSDSLDSLKKLKELLDIGILTQEEFDAKKKQILGL